ncbi:1-(5-phosphoribosyl)-5-[(5-phosphoribosylamino)methylideneamino]imidazole-4-carboxamide isomerase [Clostridium fermenticellae]|uniref:1-(5-phosphoribosyl)-5-[(5-phosphoribosylamino)methylideneamino] imidazole-4-carboxamide isomerase n=1 Tax=Clostridium fermenticellae TaxID=2068654 RepID=A0A386H314_9CLOT|nr:1-(5-phosphoribosyl)-5-[(5-phosphoribosylamino)methylideneamino]imidazole-4-carboxamide isomerase [Clostridium fermenticellae]AYD40099.1 1-(5-phosphoribosyl)-5-[(5-phosphoribosylamino)methylideneamino]imidazole-4-carboxamide isomerase [Clostridium fermenticellae]
MIIIPAIDLKEGNCVRLYQGKMSSAQVVARDAVKAALEFKAAGAEFIHMVDLDGAVRGKMYNLSQVIRVINETGLPVEVGGGIRNIETINNLIKNKISRVILGTAALNDFNMLEEAVKKYGEKIAVGIDAKDGRVAVDGWVNISKTDYIDFAKKIEDVGVKTIIFTDIGRDGTLKGANLMQLSEISSSVSCNIIASGGVSNIEDVKNLKNTGVYGVIIGKAIYSGAVSIQDAIEVGRN